MRCRFLVLAVASVLLLSPAACKTRGSGSKNSDILEAAGGGGSPYSGHSDYRLVFVRRPGPSFNPNEDLSQPSATSKAMEDVSDALRTAALHSLLPAVSLVTGQRTGGDPDLMAALMGMARKAGASLKSEIQPILAANPNQFPMVAEAMIVPWNEPATSLFYDAEKISMNAGVANVLGVSVADEAYPAKFSAAIKDMQKKLYASSPDPWFLLAARQFLFLAPGKSRLTLRVLIGMKPMTMPYSKEDNRIRFKQVVIPDVAERGPVASLTFNIDLEQATDPTLTLEFGDFQSYDKGNFVVVPGTQHRTAPRMEGQVSKQGAGWVALNFSFKKLEFNLRTVQLANIDTLLSPGLRIGGANWVVGGLHVESIDQSFQGEINSTIDGQLRGAITQANDKILDGMMTKEMMEQAFSLIFARQPQGGT